MLGTNNFFWFIPLKAIDLKASISSSISSTSSCLTSSSLASSAWFFAYDLFFFFLRFLFFFLFFLTRSFKSSSSSSVSDSAALNALMNDCLSGVRYSIAFIKKLSISREFCLSSFPQSSGHRNPIFLSKPCWIELMKYS